MPGKILRCASLLQWLLAFAWLSGCMQSGQTQNLVPNPGFEEYSECPYIGDINGPMVCEPWVSLNSCNYFNVCYPGSFGVPSNFQGYQEPHTGNAYAGGYQRFHGYSGSLEYIQVKLKEPLMTGECYHVRFFANLSNTSCGIDRLGALFTDEGNTWPGGMIPQIDGSTLYYGDTMNWFKVEGDFVAVGGEEYLTLGNFYGDGAEFDPDCLLPLTYAYYYWDDVSVEWLSPSMAFDIALDAHYVACDSVVLNPHIQEGYFTWSNGSHDSILVVTESGVYSVSVSLPGCYYGEAITEVTILSFPAVDVGPDQTMCEGETITITLDPDAGNYLWSDGSMNSTYIIDAGGTYTVQLDDGCDITWDAININEISPPDFSLGPDTLICVGDHILFHFDPTMGDFSWQDNTDNAIYLVDEAGMYALTVTNACGEHMDEVDIIQEAVPHIDLGPDVALCFGSTLEIDLDETLGEFEWHDSSILPAYSIDTSGTYSVTVTNSCGSDSDALVVEEIHIPAVDLSDNILLCPGEVVEIDLSEQQGEITWQDGSHETVYTITTHGIYAVTISNDCGSATDQMEVEAEPDISIPVLGPDTILCPGEALLLSIAPTGGVVKWSDQSTALELWVMGSGLYWVSVTTLCESYADTIEIMVAAHPPAVALPPDFTLCEGLTTVLDPGVLNVSYQWNDGSQGKQLFVDTPGIYSVTVTNACGSDADTILVSQGGAAPFVSLGVDTSMCTGDTLFIFPAYQHVDQWHWPDGTDTSFYAVIAAGQLFVVASNACGSTTDTMHIDQLPDAPSFTLGPDTVVCAGEPVVFSIQVPGVNILWSDGSTNDSVTVINTPLVIATISNVCSSFSDSAIISTLPAIPDLDLGADQSLCPGETITVAPGISDASYLWHDGSTGHIYQATQAGMISLSISNACGTSTDTLMIVESNEGPMVDLGPDIKACKDETVIIESGISGVSYVWQDGSSGNAYNAIASGTYYLVVTNACGMDSDTIDVIIEGLPPQTNLGMDTALCAGETLVLYAPDSTALYNTWQDGSTGDAMNVLSSGTYYITQQNECGVDSDTIMVSMDGLPPVTSLGPDTILCDGDILILQVQTPSDVINEWPDGSTDDIFTIVLPGTYILHQTNECGGDADSISVSFISAPLPPHLGVDTLVCEGESIMLNVPQQPGVSTIWQDGQTEDSYAITQAGQYHVTQFNACGQQADTIEVTYLALPAAFSLGADTTICQGDEMVLYAPMMNDMVQWQDGSAGPSFQVAQAGSYSLLISNTCGEAYDEIVVAVEEHIPVLPPTEFTWCPGETIEFDVTQPFPALYVWSTGDTGPRVQIITPGNYAVSVSSSCLAWSHEFAIVKDDDCAEINIYFPNIISPNGDNVNDMFTVLMHSSIEVLSMSGAIYDRWGGVMYVSNGIPFAWDGRSGSDPVLPGVYAYRIQMTYRFQGSEIRRQFVGDVTVIK